MTNEFRFNYGRIGFNFPLAASDAFHATLANYSGLGVTGLGGATNIPQFRFANNWGVPGHPDDGAGQAYIPLRR